MVACVLLNAAVATVGAAIAGELYASRTAVFVLGVRGKGRSRRSRLSMVASTVLLIFFPCLIVSLVADVVTGGGLEGVVAAVSAIWWAAGVIFFWSVLGTVVHLTRTEAYRQGYRDGVPVSYWLLSSAASLRHGGGFAFVFAEAQRVVPSGATVVTVARTDTLRKIYERNGFHRVRPGKLVLVRP